MLILWLISLSKGYESLGGLVTSRDRPPLRLEKIVHPLGAIPMEPLYRKYKIVPKKIIKFV